MAGKKPSLADVAMIDPEAGAEDEDTGAEDEGYDAAIEEFLDAIGVPDDKRDAAASAFQAAVMSCK